MPPPTAFCPTCGQPASPTASFCAFCGAQLAAAAQAKVVAAWKPEPIPDRGALSGPCVVLYAGKNEMDIRRVGRFVSEAIGRPLPDVTRSMRGSRGFIAGPLDASKAAALAGRIEKEAETPAFVLPESACVPLPPVMRMRRVNVDATGIRCEAYTWNATENVEVAWPEILLIACARLEMQQAIESRDGAVGKREPLIMGYPVPGLVMETRYEHLLDIVLVNPWRRLRLDQNTTAFSMTEMNADPSAAVGPLYRSAVNLDRFAVGVPKNAGVSLLASEPGPGQWDILTFLNKKDFDSYTWWLMQLVRYGLPIPS